VIRTGGGPGTAVARYMKLDSNATLNLDRLFEIVIDKQRQRDELTGFELAGLIAGYFRDEPVFPTPHHPNARVAVALAAQFFEKMGVGQSEIDRMRRAIRITPFPKDQLPIHPNVCRHFGLRFVTDPDAHRWRFMSEGTITAPHIAPRRQLAAPGGTHG